MYYKICALTASFLLSLISIPMILLFSKKHNLYDTVDDRKVHTGHISRLGGIGITLGFSSSIVVLLLTGQLDTLRQNLWFLVASCIIITTMGIVDDIVTLPAKAKLFTQMLAAVISLIGGFKFSILSIGIYSVNIGLLAYPLTFIWIIGVTNAVNLIDGIDGQCGNISIITALTFCMFFFKELNTSAMAICMCLVCAVLGFLVFNWPIPKAKIFMGDGGSQTLGFILSVLPLLSSKGSFPSISILYAAAVLMIPIFDTFAAIWRRLREHRSIGSPDKFHIHHKLMLFGFSNRGALLIVTTFQIVIGIFLCCSLWMGGTIGVILLAAIYAMGILFFYIIHYGKVKTVTEIEKAENNKN
ncbi:MAG: MraY family glycosyltransferase [Treponemataceae bacterium]